MRSTNDENFFSTYDTLIRETSTEACESHMNRNVSISYVMESLWDRDIKKFLIWT